MNFSDVLAVVGVAASVIGIPITFVVARRGRQVPDLRYSIDFDVLVAAEDRLFGRGLVVTSDGHPIESVSRSRVAIWNNRGDTVRGSEIVENDPLRIGVSSSDAILQARIVAKSRPQIGIKIDPGKDKQTVLIGFDFLDPGDGFIIEIMHGKAKAAEVSGTIRGVRLSERPQTDLSPKTLRVAAQSSRVKRFLKKVSRHRFYRLMFVTIVFEALTFFAIGVVAFVSIPSHPRLVNVGGYKLDTLQGQRDFANKVVVEGQPGFRLIILGSAMGLFTLMFTASVLFFWINSRVMIPPGIARNAIENPSEGPA